MRSERKQGFGTAPVPVSAYDGSSKNLKELKDANAWWAANENVDEYGGGAHPNVVASKLAEICAIHT